MRGDGSIYKRPGSPYWWIRYSAPGKDGKAHGYAESSKSTDPVTAEKLLRKRKREADNHRDGIRPFQGPAAERLTVANLLDALVAKYTTEQKIKSLRQMLGHMKPIREFFGHRRALSVTPDTGRAYIEQRREEGAATATINRELATLKRAFSVAHQEQRLAVKPYIPSAGPEDNARSGFFEREEFERMAAALDPVMADMALFGYCVGWRASEIRLLTWDRVDRAAREIRLSTTKNGRPRLVPMDDDLAALFERRWVARQFTRRDAARARAERPFTMALSEYVFHEDGKPLSQSVFNKRWDAARTIAGVTRIFHDLRRTAVRNMIRSGVSETVALAIGGWVTRSMLDRYNITSTADMLEALRKRKEYVAGQGTNVAQFRKD